MNAPDNPAQRIYPLQFQAAAAASVQHDAEITRRAPWLHLPLLHAECLKILNMNGSVRTKLRHLDMLADKIATAIAPSAPCQRGCNSCCHIATEITEFEAERIHQATGRKLGKPSAHQMGDIARKRVDYFGRPCPFLGGGECTIYASRPITCRVYYTLNNDAFFCSFGIPPEHSMVSQRNLSPLWMAYAELALQGGAHYGDIREYFPD